MGLVSIFHFKAVAESSMDLSSCLSMFYILVQINFEFVSELLKACTVDPH